MKDCNAQYILDIFLILQLGQDMLLLWVLKISEILL